MVSSTNDSPRLFHTAIGGYFRDPANYRSGAATIAGHLENNTHYHRPAYTAAKYTASACKNCTSPRSDYKEKGWAKNKFQNNFIGTRSPKEEHADDGAFSIQPNLASGERSGETQSYLGTFSGSGMTGSCGQPYRRGQRTNIHYRNNNESNNADRPISTIPTNTRDNNANNSTNRQNTTMTN
ncbi:hypothetical protein V9T40_000093 [Parthenolecanium corni]|uniref:Uncharacterized protein n=1 Tax=Parthenolecanium corni TaxID=536013 RepID=A0AAN9TS13_9HEMI